MIPQKHGDKPIPFLLQRLIHGEGAVGNPGGAGQLLVLVSEIQKHAGDVLLRKGTAGTLQSAPLIFRGELKYELEAQRSAVALDQLKADGAKQCEGRNGSLGKNLVGLVLQAVKIRVQVAVDGVAGEGVNSGFRQQKVVKEIRAEQLVHKIFDVNQG